MSDATNRAKDSGPAAGKGNPMETRRKGEGLSDESSQRIGNELKAYYDGLVNEPLPDRFTQLLQQMEAQEKAGGKGGAD